VKQSRRIGSRFFMLLVFLFLYLPIFVLIVFSFNASKSRSVWSGFTLDWYKELFQNSMILDALWVTLAVSILAAVISTIIGTAGAPGFPQGTTPPPSAPPPPAAAAARWSPPSTTSP